ncbi:MAG: hypothetical protein ACK4N5_01415 [Myxococcales bacterium]
MTTTEKLRAAALATTVALLAAVAAQQVAPTMNEDGSHAAIGLAPDGSLGLLYTVRGSAAAFGALGMRLPDGGVIADTYAVARVCVVAAEDAVEPGPPLPAGIDVVDVAEPQPCAPGAPALEVWRADHPAAPWDCACSTGAGCWTPAADGGTAAAPLGVTLPPGTFTGDGCRPKPCVELAGASSWPAACPEHLESAP